jgi:hypothetical protein
MQQEDGCMCPMGFLARALGLRIGYATAPSWTMFQQRAWPEGVLTPLGDNSALTLAIIDRNDSPVDEGREADLMGMFRLLDIELSFEG